MPACLINVWRGPSYESDDPLGFLCSYGRKIWWSALKYDPVLGDLVKVILFSDNIWFVCPIKLEVVKLPRDIQNTSVSVGK